MERMESMVKRILLFYLSVIFFSGCFHSNPVKTESAKPIEYSRVFKKEYLTPKKTVGILVLKEDKASLTFPWIICPVDIFIGGEKVAEIRTGEKLILYLSPGIYVIGMKPKSVCNLIQKLTNLTVEVKQGQKYVYRIGVDHSGWYFLAPEPTE
jgi:hypothetical protein